MQSFNFPTWHNKNAVGHTREEIVKQVKEKGKSVHDYASYVHDDNKIGSDVVLGVVVARSGTVSRVYKTGYPPPFSFRNGTSVLEVFKRMEKYVMTNGRYF